MSKWLFLIILTIPRLLYAVDSVSFTIHHLYQSPRALGMGDAFVAIANDTSGFYYNPAGLAHREASDWNFGVITAGTSPDTLDFYNDLKGIQKSDMTETEKQDALIDLLQENYGESYMIKLSLLELIWARPHWGFGFLPANISIEATLHEQIGPAINTTLFADTSLTLGYGNHFDTPNGNLAWGVSGKFVNRGYFSQVVSATELADNSDPVAREDISEGYTVDADAGVLWRPDFLSESMSFAVVARNLFNLGFENSLGLLNKDSPSNPEPLYRVYDIGSAWEFPESSPLAGRVALDLRDIDHPNFNWKKGSHFGVEVDWLPTTWFKNHFRLGLSQTYWTAGYTVELANAVLDFVSYAENVGTYNIAQESRTYLFKLNVNF